MLFLRSASVLAAFFLLTASACTSPADEEPVERRDDRVELQECRNLGRLVAHVKRGYVPFRSPDIGLIPREPNYLGTRSAPVHSGPWDYLTHVPLVVYGPGLIEARGEVGARATMADVAPTTAAMIGFDDFPERDGRVLDEALPAPGNDPPAVVIAIVWDGAGWNALEAHPDSWPYLRSVMDEGVTFTNFTVGSSPSVTPPVHTTLGTGAFPETHGIPGLRMRNEDYEYVNPFGHLDARNMEVTTLADEYGRAMGNRPVTGMLGWVNWHLGMIGHGAALEGKDADPVALISREGDVHTNTAIYSLPDVADPDVRDRFTLELDRDDGAADGMWLDNDLADDIWHRTPAAIDYQQFLLERMITTEGFGADDAPDLLYVNFKSADTAFHQWGLNSPEVGEAFAAQDRALEDLVAHLDDVVGEGRWVVMVTSDHGMTPYPEESGGWPISGGELARDANAHFAEEGRERLIHRVSSPGMFVDLDELEARGMTLEEIAEWVAGYTLRENLRDGEEVPPEWEGREDERLFDAAVVRRGAVVKGCK